MYAIQVIAPWGVILSVSLTSTGKSPPKERYTFCVTYLGNTAKRNCCLGNIIFYTRYQLFVNTVITKINVGSILG